MLYNPDALDALDDEAIAGLAESWGGFCALTGALLRRRSDLHAGQELAPLVSALCARGLASLVHDHFLRSLEETFKQNAVEKFWQHFDGYCNASELQKVEFHDQENWPEEVLSKALEETCLERGYQEKCLRILAHALESYEDSKSEGRTKAGCYSSNLISRYQLMVASVFLTTLPWSFPGF